MTTSYPIILYPHALTLAWKQRPPIPAFHGIEPSPPAPPKVVNWKIILVEMAITSVMAICFGPLVFGICLVVTVTHVLIQQDTRRRRHRRFQAQMMRYEKELQKYLKKEANHRIYCETSQDPQSVAQYQYQLVLAALKTTEAYDLEIGYDIQDSGIRRDLAEDFLEPYLNKYFPSKILTKAALSHSSCHDIYVPKFAYVDLMTGLHINIEIDEPYILKTGQPVHYLGNANDGDRNDFFLEKGWLVMRFSEEQVLRYPQSCCKALAKQIFKITAQTGLMERFERVANLEAVEQWSWTEAEDMALKDYRFTYLNCNLEEPESDEFDSRELLKQASQALLELGN